MNGKRARAIRSYTNSRAEYRAGKHFFTRLGTFRAQAPAEVKERFKRPMAVAGRGITIGPLRMAFEICRRKGLGYRMIRDAVPAGYARGPRHESLDRLFGRLPGPVIRSTIAKLKAI